MPGVHAVRSTRPARRRARCPSGRSGRRSRRDRSSPGREARLAAASGASRRPAPIVPNGAGSETREMSRAPKTVAHGNEKRSKRGARVGSCVRHQASIAVTSPVIRGRPVREAVRGALGVRVDDVDREAGGGVRAAGRSRRRPSRTTESASMRARRGSQPTSAPRRPSTTTRRFTPATLAGHVLKRLG